MTPYYQDEYITLYHGKCEDILPELKDKYFCFSDPPYNVKMDYGDNKDNISDADYLKWIELWINQLKLICPEICIYTPRKYLLDYWNLLGKEFQQIILTWSPEGGIRNGFVNQHAQLLTNAKPKERTKDVWENTKGRFQGYFFKEESYNHPGYTSEELTLKIIGHLADKQLTILDIFSGTGTTLFSAKRLNRKCIGIEQEEKWCEVAAKRCSQQVFNF